MDVSKQLEKARQAAERRNYDYAIELYMHACKMDPDNVPARRELRAVENRMAKEKGTSFMTKAKVMGIHGKVQVLFKTRKFDSAVDTAEEALKLDPGNIGVLMLLGRAALMAGYKQTAIATFEDIKNMNAGGNNKALVEALRELAVAYEMDNRIKEAMDTWQQVLRHSPGDRDGTVKIRDLSAKTMSAQIETAAKSGERGAAARSTQTDEQKTAALAQDLDKGGIKSEADLKMAVDLCKQEIQKRPDDPRLYAKLGDLCKQGNLYAEAKKAYETAREKDANNFTWLFRLHDLEIWKMVQSIRALAAKFKAADTASKPALKEQHDKEVLALLDFRLTSFSEREKQYSTDSSICFQLGQVYMELAQHRKDRVLFDQAINRFQRTGQDPKFRVESGLKLGLCFAAKSQFDLAIKRFDETLRGMELKNEAWKNLMYFKADTLQKSGKLDEAKKVFLEVYEIDVSFKDIGKRVDDLSHEVAAQDGQGAAQS